MGMILLPVLFGAFIIFIRAAYLLFSLIRENELSIEAIALGTLVPIVIILLTMFLWIQKGKVYAFVPLFRFPIVLIYLPFALQFIFFMFPKTSLVQTSLIFWIVFSGIIMWPLFKYYSRFLKKKGVNFYH